MMCYSVMTQAYSEKEIPSFPNRSRTYDLPITSSDALPRSHLFTRLKIFHHISSHSRNLSRSNICSLFLRGIQLLSVLSGFP